MDYCVLPDPRYQGEFRIRHTFDPNMCMELKDGSTDNFTRLVMRPCTTGPYGYNQLFTMSSDFKIKSKQGLYESICLEMDPSSTWGGVFIHRACLDTWSWQIDGNNNGIYYIRNNGDNLCLGISNPYSITSGRQLNRYTCGSTNAKFTFKWSWLDSVKCYIYLMRRW